jgi:hypothetical protein
LEGLLPLLVSPGAGAALSSDPIEPTWRSLSGAEDYRFELRSGGQSGPLVTALIVVDTSVTLDALAEGTYTWGVQAQNANSASTFSYRAMVVDRSAPGTPVLTAPTNGGQLPNAPFTFQWQSGSNAGEGALDSLFVRDDANQLLRQVLAPTPSWPDSLGPGTYTWYVRTIDRAGNGSSSVDHAFQVQ